MLPTLTTSRLGLRDPLATLRTPLDEWFRAVSHGYAPGPQAATWRAPLDLWEKDGQYHVEVELPGVHQDDVQVTYENGRLTITAERRAPEEERSAWYRERGYGRIERSVRLAETVDPDSIQAELTHGVLRLTFSKRPELQPKRIEVKAN